MKICDANIPEEGMYLALFASQVSKGTEIDWNDPYDGIWWYLQILIQLPNKFRNIHQRFVSRLRTMFMILHYSWLIRNFLTGISVRKYDYMAHRPVHDSFIFSEHQLYVDVPGSE